MYTKLICDDLVLKDLDGLLDILYSNFLIMKNEIFLLPQHQIMNEILEVTHNPSSAIKNNQIHQAGERKGFFESCP